MTAPEDTRTAITWNGVLDPAQWVPEVVAARHRLADAARTGDWALVMRLLDEPGADVNGWRPGGTAWFTPLHQAAWYGASVSVAAELVTRGALRTLTDARGRTARDIRQRRDSKEFRAKGAAAQSHLALRSFLAPPAPDLSPDLIRALDAHLAAVIDGRISGVLYDGRDPRSVLRYPPVAILHEVPDRRLWFPVPEMHGGFDIRLRQNYLEVYSWCRIVGGSGQLHLITEGGAILVDQGFV